MTSFQRYDPGPHPLIFDVGNVLYGWDPESFLAREIPEDEARLRFIEDTDLWGWHDSLDGGRAFDEAAAELSEKFPDYAAYISAWGERFGERIGERIGDPVEGVRAIVEELDARGVPLFGITNSSADFWKPFRAKEGSFFRRFRDIVVSSKEKLLKPDPAIYYLALGRFGFAPPRPCPSTTERSTWRAPGPWGWTPASSPAPVACAATSRPRAFSEL